MQRQFGNSSTAVVVDQKEHMIHTESEQMGVRGNNTDQHNIGGTRPLSGFCGY